MYANHKSRLILNVPEDFHDDDAIKLSNSPIVHSEVKSQDVSNPPRIYIKGKSNFYQQTVTIFGALSGRAPGGSTEHTLWRRKLGGMGGREGGRGPRWGLQ